MINIPRGLGLNTALEMLPTGQEKWGPEGKQGSKMIRGIPAVKTGIVLWTPDRSA